MIVHDITDPYFAEVVRGVEDAAATAGYLVITCWSERDAEREREYVRLLRSMRAAAVMFAGSGLDDPALNEEMDRHVDGDARAGAAVVHLSPHALGEPEVSVDNAGGIAAMVRALAGLGHRRIAFLAGPTIADVARQRLDGFRLGMADAGLDPDERSSSTRRSTATAGPRASTRCARRACRSRPSRCANDLLALGALARLAELGIRVPDDVSVAGFDDIAVAADTSPSLSTVRVPLRELGRHGFAQAERLLAGRPLPGEVLPAEVVLRKSTAALASNNAHTRGTP